MESREKYKKKIFTQSPKSGKSCLTFSIYTCIFSRPPARSQYLVKQQHFSEINNNHIFKRSSFKKNFIIFPIFFEMVPGGRLIAAVSRSISSPIYNKVEQWTINQFINDYYFFIEK